MATPETRTVTLTTKELLLISEALRSAAFTLRNDKYSQGGFYEGNQRATAMTSLRVLLIEPLAMANLSSLTSEDRQAT